MKALKADSLFSENIINDFRHQLEDLQVLSFFETRPLMGLHLVSTVELYLHPLGLRFNNSLDCR
jgi:hypothetical protein